MRISDWVQRFGDYELHKTIAARAAVIEPFVTDRDEAGEELAVIGNAWSRSMFGGLFHVSQPPSRDLPATNLVFVQSRDGNTVTNHPESLGGGDADKHLIYEGLSQVGVDAVLVGAGTIRAAAMSCLASGIGNWSVFALPSASLDIQSRSSQPWWMETTDWRRGPVVEARTARRRSVRALARDVLPVVGAVAGRRERGEPGASAAGRGRSARGELWARGGTARASGVWGE